MAPIERSFDKRHRYEAAITLMIHADSLDEAHRLHRAAARKIEANFPAHIAATAPMLTLNYRPDLDG